MFTGIVAAIGRVAALEKRGQDGSSRRFQIEVSQDLARILDDLAIGASIACAGVCLTVTARERRRFAVDATPETLSRSTLGGWREGRAVNLERALALGDELGGHLVSGHVDAVGETLSRAPADDGLRLEFAAPAALAPFIAEQGSLTVDGVALTVTAVSDHEQGCRFAVAVIPHTLRATTLGELQPGAAVNLEIDLLARYLHRALMSRHGGLAPAGGRGRE